ncbi:DNAse1 protein [Niveomyces insectorum RCEF 264]|uniref:DNAse1 protein n=1 Tax=Niveomyces insectorum RCEF 264 TaxID=1081102 RepID=A0A162J6H7_9HYPO|nr:DNAse1 protein [Niveomyces insectorum RCEF 264]
MAFLKIAATVFFAVAASAANVITFQSLDSTDRTVYVTPSAGVEGPQPVDVPGGASVDVTFVEGFLGNAYAVKKGAANTPGMLAEVNFNGWNGLTYFDVSAIVDPNDKDNVKEMYPADGSKTPVSGCSNFPCNNAYYQPDDIQTKSTDQTHLIVTLGQNNGAASKRAEHTDVGRNFVVEKY